MLRSDLSPWISDAPSPLRRWSAQTGWSAGTQKPFSIFKGFPANSPSPFRFSGRIPPSWPRLPARLSARGPLSWMLIWAARSKNPEDRGRSGPHAGAWQGRAYFKKMRESVKVPLTVKMRSGWKADLNAPHIAALAEENGFDAVIVHPRTVEQGFTGKADWCVIREVKQRVRIPVIGNGDIQSAVDAADMVRETGCDGIMVGRGGMGSPLDLHGDRNIPEYGHSAGSAGAGRKVERDRAAPWKIRRLERGGRAEDSKEESCLVHKGAEGIVRVQDPDCRM